MAEDDNNADDEEEGGASRWMSLIVVLLAVSGFFGLAWYAYKNGGEAIDESDVELIKADKTPVKEAPANPGGMQIPNQDKTVYNLIGGNQEKTPKVERLLPAPEEPLPRGNIETWMSESVKNKMQGGEETNSAPAAGSVSPHEGKEQFNPAKLRAAAAKAAQSQAVAGIPLTSPDPSGPAAAAVDPKPGTIAVSPQGEAKEPLSAEQKKPESATGAVEVPKAEVKGSPVADVPPAAEGGGASPPAGVRIQLGAFKSQAEAEGNWTKILRHFAEDLKDKQHYIVKADLGKKGVYYRLQVAPFSSSGDAERFCLGFVSAGQGCILARGK